MKQKTCMVTGHRDIPAEKLDYVKKALRREVEAAIEKGYTHFLSGFANGVDLYFAAIVAELKEKCNLSLEAAIPYRNRLNSKNAEFQRLLPYCDSIRVHSEAYSKGCFLLRNRFMVQASDLVIAVYDGRDSGGTLFTMQYARTIGREVIIIKI